MGSVTFDFGLGITTGTGSGSNGFGSFWAGDRYDWDRLGKQQEAMGSKTTLGGATHSTQLLGSKAGKQSREAKLLLERRPPHSGPGKVILPNMSLAGTNSGILGSKTLLLGFSR